jgi:hypothetical protein
MAVDSQEKRQNASGVGRSWMRGSRFPVGATDEQSRIASGLGYGGNALSAAGNVLASQLRSAFRMTFGRVFGRVN